MYRALTRHGTNDFRSRSIAFGASTGHPTEAGVAGFRDPIALVEVFAPGVLLVGPEALVRVLEPLFPSTAIPRRRAALKENSSAYCLDKTSSDIPSK